jgi:lactose/L-arabinose transport system permease protein
MASPTHLVLALALAVALNAGFVRLRGVLRTVLFLPAITSLVVVAVVFSILFNTSFGLINQVAGVFGISNVPWLDEPLWAKVTVALVLVWRWTGYMMVIYLAALQTIPRELYDAAAVDGAGAWNQFRHVTLPQLRPTILFTVILSLIGTSQLFDEPFVLTRGGPGNATETVAMFLYKNGFEFFDAPYASAVAYSLVLIVAVLTFLSMRVGSRGVA